MRRSPGAQTPVDGLGFDLTAMRTLVDGLQANVFVAAPDLRLVYANAAAQQAFGSIAAEVQRRFNVGLNDLIGGSIHRFHQDPQRIERILATAAMPHRATFSFGEVTLDTRINRLADGRGTLLGYVVVWEDQSRRRVLEESLRIAVSSLENTGSGFSESSAQMAAAAETAAIQASSVAVATEQLTSTLQEVTRATALAVSTADGATHAAREATDLVAELSRAGSEVGEMVRLIETIAQQTNLLALNATIEAARAGDSGRGFAVVAAEVKELSNSTRQGTERIGRLTERLSSLSAQVSEALAGISLAITEICDQQTTIASAMEEQSAATSEITIAVSHVAAASADASHLAGEVSGRVNEAAAQLGDNARMFGEILNAS